jgi:thiamine transport system permease protein
MRRTYSSAALSLGARPVRVFFSIELPLLKNAIISGSVFAVAISLGEINATLILADEHTITIPILLYRLIGSYNFYAACAVGTLLVAMCIILFSLFEYLREKL